MLDHIDIASVQIADGFFLARADRRGSSRSRATHGRTVFTRPNQEASLRDALYELVDSAQRKLFVCSFLLDDPGLVDRLGRAAQRLRGSVYVVTALKDEWLKDTFGDPDEAPSRPMKHLIEPLVKAGVQVRGCPQAHAKFAVADDREALISTANFDVRGLIATGEAGLRVSAPEEVLRLSRFFSRLWLSRCELEMPHDRSGRFTVRAAKRPSTSPVVPQAPTTSMDRIIWTDGREQLIVEAIAATADVAQRELVVCTYDVQGIHRLRDQVVAPLERAMQRGVHVQLLTRIRNPRRSTRESLRRLAALGVEVRGDSTNHAKFIIADRKSGALFSANLDAEHGLTSGIETGAAVCGEEAAALCGYFEEAFNDVASAPFVDAPTHADVNQHLRARFRRPWDSQRDLLVSCDAKVWQNIRLAVQTGEPVLFEDSGKELRLHAATEVFDMDTLAGTLVHVRRGKGLSPGRNSSQLLDQWLSDREEPSTPRGIFAGTLRAEVAAEPVAKPEASTASRGPSQ